MSLCRSPSDGGFPNMRGRFPTLTCGPRRAAFHNDPVDDLFSSRRAGHACRRAFVLRDVGLAGPINDPRANGELKSLLADDGARQTRLDFGPQCRICRGFGAIARCTGRMPASGRCAGGCVWACSVCQARIRLLLANGKANPRRALACFILYSLSPGGPSATQENHQEHLEGSGSSAKEDLGRTPCQSRRPREETVDGIASRSLCSWRVFVFLKEKSSVMLVPEIGETSHASVLESACRGRCRFHLPVCSLAVSLALAPSCLIPCLIP